MGIEKMRRWPLYVVISLCLALFISLLSSWMTEDELRKRLTEVSAQLHECSKQQTSCMEESLTLLEQRESYVGKVKDLDKQKSNLQNDLTDYKEKLTKSEALVNRTRVDVEYCKTELQSLKSLQLSKTAMLETLRLDKDTLTTQLTERKQKIEELEKEIDKLKSALTTKSAPNPSISPKVTPAAQPPKLSPALNANNPINEPVLDNNDAKEEVEDTNALNDGQEFDPQLQ